MYYGYGYGYIQKIICYMYVYVHIVYTKEVCMDVHVCRGVPSRPPTTC